MLTRVHQVLLGTLVLQVVLAIVVWTHGGGAAPKKDALLLPGFSAAAVTRVQVFGPGATTPIDLVKTGATWAVASSWNYPADGKKIEEALEPLAKTMGGAPMATAAGRHAQLGVAADNFQRKLVITAGEKDTTLYLGSSAGGGGSRTPLRIGTSNDVFGASGVSTWTWSVDAHGWVDPKYVDVPTEDVAKIEIARGADVVTLEKPAPVAAGSGSGAAEPTWTAAIAGAPVAPGPDEELDAAAIDQVVATLSSLALTQPADPKRDVSHPTAVITIDRKPGAAPAAPDVLDVIADGENYYVHRRGDARAILVAKQVLENAVTLDRGKLVKKTAPAAGSADLQGMPPGMDLQGFPPGMEGMELPPGMGRAVADISYRCRALAAALQARGVSSGSSA